MTHNDLRYEFGPYQLNPSKRILTRDGEGIPLTPKATEILLVLVKHAGQLVEKDELLKEGWPRHVCRNHRPLWLPITGSVKTIGVDEHKSEDVELDYLADGLTHNVHQQSLTPFACWKFRRALLRHLFSVKTEINRAERLFRVAERWIGMKRIKFQTS